MALCVLYSSRSYFVSCVSHRAVHIFYPLSYILWVESLVFLFKNWSCWYQSCNLQLLIIAKRLCRDYFLLSGLSCLNRRIVQYQYWLTQSGVTSTTRFSFSSVPPSLSPQQTTTTSIFPQDLAIQIQQVCNKHWVIVIYQHIPGVLNAKADKLSRIKKPIYGTEISNT